MIERLSEAMSSALVGNKLSQTTKKISHEKKRYVVSDSSLLKIYKPLQPFWVVLSRYRLGIARGVAHFPQQLPQTWKHPVFVLAHYTSPSCARLQPQKLGHWFCSQNLQLPSGIVLGVIARWPAGAWNRTWILQPDWLLRLYLSLNLLTSAAWQTLRFYLSLNLLECLGPGTFWLTLQFSGFCHPLHF